MNKNILLSMFPMYYNYIENTPIGAIGATCTKKGVKAILITTFKEALLTRIERIKLPIEYSPQKLEPLFIQIQEYLSGDRHQFTLEIDWSEMAPFQEKVLRATLAIPYGQTRTYREIAELLGNPNAARAVGHVEATNPLLIIIPCHRVIGTDGNLRGYAGGQGIPTKQWLLDLEMGKLKFL